MNLSALLIFAAAYFAALVLPGPGVTALVARVLARGTHGAAVFIAGFVVGTLAWFSIAATGLAVLASSFATIFIAIRYVGAGYLLYLAWKLWNAPARALDAEPAPLGNRWRIFLTGVAINLGNPKVIVFFLALLPTVADLGALTLPGFAELVLTVIAIASTVLGAYVVAAAHARRLFMSARSVRLMNRGSGVAMAGAAVTIAVR